MWDLQYRPCWFELRTSNFVRSLGDGFTRRKVVAIAVLRHFELAEVDMVFPILTHAMNSLVDLQTVSPTLDGNGGTVFNRCMHRCLSPIKKEASFKCGLCFLGRG
jgi:hypothetical protein